MLLDRKSCILKLSHCFKGLGPQCLLSTFPLFLSAYPRQCSTPAGDVRSRMADPRSCVRTRHETGLAGACLSSVPAQPHRRPRHFPRHLHCRGRVIDLHLLHTLFVYRAHASRNFPPVAVAVVVPLSLPPPTTTRRTRICRRQPTSGVKIILIKKNSALF